MTWPFLLVTRAGHPLPANALLAVWLESPVHLRHHRYVPVPELASDQLERGAGARHPNGPVVPGIVESVARKPQRPQALAMPIACYPLVHPAKDALTGQHARQVGLDEGPRPVRHPSESIARPRLRAPGSHLPSGRIEVGVHQGEDRADLEAGAIGKGEDRLVGGEAPSTIRRAAWGSTEW